MKSLKVEDALSYLDEVKERFAGQGAIYKDFLEVMREFKMQTIDTDVVIRRVRELFEGHSDLILGFNNFIPQGYRMETTPVRHQIRSAIPCIENISPTKTYTVTPIKYEANNEQNVDTKTISALNIDNMLSEEDPFQLDAGATRTGTVNYSDHFSCPLTQHSQAPSVVSNYHRSHYGVSNSLPGSLLYPQPTQPHSFHHQPQQQQHNVQHPQQTQSFNHALHYVNKVKNHFQDVPNFYKRFLDILQWYQREQRNSDPLRRKVAEKQVYQDVAKLFDGYDNLLEEFSQFLPESTGVVNESFMTRRLSSQIQQNIEPLDATPVPQVISSISESIPLAFSPRLRSDINSQPGVHPNADVKKLKRLAPSQVDSLIPISTANNYAGLTKKPRTTVYNDVSIADLNELTTGFDIVLLHKIRELFEAENTGGDRLYQTFLQTLSLYNRNILSADELFESVHPLFPRSVELWHRFCEMIASNSPHLCNESTNGDIPANNPSGVEGRDSERRTSAGQLLDTLPLDSAVENTSNDNINSNNNNNPPLSIDPLHKRLDLDFAKLRTCGTSYRALPSGFPQSKCSGRLKCRIAREVLNDYYISFSSLSSEDSQFVSSKKNQYEEHMYRVEDERYEVDMVTELNRAAMQNLVIVKRKLDRMSRDEVNQFTLDDNLGGTSAILMRKAVHRVYGDKAVDVIYGLKTCPNTVIQLVIQRMQQKESEWNEATRIYRRSWADQDNRNYLRSLDHQGATFKQRDAPLIRSKTMVNQIEAIARDASARSTTKSVDPVGSIISASLTQPCLTNRTDLKNPGTFGSALINVNEGHQDPHGPHLAMVYPPRRALESLLHDAACLIIHHVKRQSNTSKEDKRTMKFLMRTVVQDLFMFERFPMSDDEAEADDENEDLYPEVDDQPPPDDSVTELNRTRLSRQSKLNRSRKPDSMEIDNPIATDPITETQPPHSLSDIPLMGQTKTSRANDAEGICASSHENHPLLPATSFSHHHRSEYYSLLYGNNHWYAFLRLHHLLLCRMHLFQTRSMELVAQANVEHTAPVQAAELLRLRRHGTTEPSDYYEKALSLVKDLLDGAEDVTSYEDRLRDMFGVYAYPWFTLDRLVINIIRQLQSLASGDELSQRLTSLHRQWSTGGSGGSDSSMCFSPLSHHRPQTVVPYNSGVRGPICTRFCRLENEAKYCSQALSIVNSFAGFGATTSNAPTPSQSGTSTNSSAITSTTNTGALPIPSSAIASIPNFYTIVMLAEASTLLIRLHTSPLTPTRSVDICDASLLHSCHVPRVASPHQAISSPVVPDDDDDHMSSIPTHFAPNDRWSNYLTSHLIWTSGYVPNNMAVNIRPVFLYRTVRRGIRALTQNAYRRRQQQLVETGDVQPEELLLKAVQSLKQSNTDSSEAESTTHSELTEPVGVVEEKVSDNSRITEDSNFENDVWEFMCHVFKSDLTRKELFRDTYASDCMQSTNHMSTKPNPRAYKINWSVGSYGVFIRRKRRSLPLSTSHVLKWRDFHSRWLKLHLKSGEIADNVPTAISSKEEGNIPDDYSPELMDTKSITAHDIVPPVSDADTADSPANPLTSFGDKSPEDNPLDSSFA